MKTRRERRKQAKLDWKKDKKLKKTILNYTEFWRDLLNKGGK